MSKRTKNRRWWIHILHQKRQNETRQQTSTTNNYKRTTEFNFNLYSFSLCFSLMILNILLTLITQWNEEKRQEKLNFPTCSLLSCVCLRQLPHCALFCSFLSTIELVGDNPSSTHHYVFNLHNHELSSKPTLLWHNFFSTLSCLWHFGNGKFLIKKV